MMNILIFGPQGSGKSTQAELLAERLGLPLVSAGDISREIAKEDSGQGQRVKALLDKGELTPDEIIVPAVSKRLTQPDCKSGFVADGWPRTLHQAKLTRQKIDLVVVINVPEETSIARLVKRGRFDDTPQAIRERLKIYWSETKPVIDYYRQQGVKVVELSGEPSIEKIQAQILSWSKKLEG